MRQFALALGLVVLFVGPTSVVFAQTAAPASTGQASTCKPPMACAVSNAGVDARDKDGRTQLIIEAGGGPADKIRSLIAAGADVNAKANDGMTALMRSAAVGMVEWVNILITAGAVVDAKDNKGWTALMWVARSNERLVNKGQNGGWIPAQGYSPEGSASALIAAGADIKATDNDGASVVMGATNNDSVKLLIARGADVNVRDRSGKTAIMRLASPTMATNPSIIRLLVAAGADINARDNDGKTALMLASTFVVTSPRFVTGRDGLIIGVNGEDRKVGNMDLVTALIANGADVNAKDKAGKSVMSLARSAKSDCINILRTAHAK